MFGLRGRHNAPLVFKQGLFLNIMYMILYSDQLGFIGTPKRPFWSKSDISYSMLFVY